MLAPLEYLTTTDEFKNINSATNPKVALDNFWLRTSDNTDIGREMIRVYYTRLYYANLYFTSYKQGWQTDRGMIYAVFGPPSYIRKTENSETWQYYVRQNATNLTLVFLRVDSPYSDNNFKLVRDESFTSFWRDAVNSWRSGKVYSLEE